MWNQRYAEPGFLFGTEPADFLKRHAAVLPDGAGVLAVADGEGRNSVYLAGLGHRVTAMEYSPVALAKAADLAAARGVTVNRQQGDIFAWDWAPDAFDAVVAVFIQFAPPPQRRLIHQGIARTLRPGGLLLMHGYAPRQVGYGTGGPPSAANMYELPLLAADFPGWQVLHQADYDADLAEGSRHVGRSALVDFIARKPG